MEIGIPGSWGDFCGGPAVVLCNRRDAALVSLGTPRENLLGRLGLGYWLVIGYLWIQQPAHLRRSHSSEGLN